MPQTDSEQIDPSVLCDTHCHISKEFVKSVSDPMCLFDFNCRILMLNESATKLVGAQSEDFFVGKNVLDFILPKDHPQVLEYVKHCIDTQLANQGECSIKTTTGRTLPIKTTSFIVSNKAADPVALLSLVKNASHDDASKNQGIEPSQKAQLYLDLLRHDISNKLQVIMSSAELLRDQIDELTKSGLIQSILESVSSCKRIIWQTEILENYTTQPLKIEYLDVITKSVLYNLIKSTDDIVVNANIQIDNAAIACDEYVTALLENILHNAWKHNLGNDKLIWITLKEEDSGYQFIVSDNGPGITEDLRNNGICVQGRSSGIGLYICHVLIEKYQGWMHITDRIEGHPEKGTQVSVWFPKYNQSIMHDSNQP